MTVRRSPAQPRAEPDRWERIGSVVTITHTYLVRCWMTDCHWQSFYDGLAAARTQRVRHLRRYHPEQPVNGST